MLHKPQQEQSRRHASGKRCRRLAEYACLALLAPRSDCHLL